MKFAVAGFCALSCCAAGSDYRPEARVNGTLRVWGSAQMFGLVERWERGFARYHPDVRFENHLYGAVSAIAGLYTGVAELVVSREIWPIELLAFQQVRGYSPVSFDVATGSFDVPTKSSSLDIFVHRDNPVAQLGFTQLAGIFGASGAVRTWGDLGLTGAWRDRPLHLYGYRPDNAGSQLFASLVFGRNSLWNCRYQGFENATTTSGKRIDAGQQALDALTRDPLGIALSNIHYATKQVKAVAIARADSGPWILPSRESVRSRTYPLTREVYIFVDRTPNAPLNARCREFVKYVLSRNGQADVADEGDYLPLADGAVPKATR